MNENDTAYERLAHAVIALAAADYKKALKNNDRGKKKHLESFFFGEWFTKLSGGAVDPRYITERIKEEVKKEEHETY